MPINKFKFVFVHFRKYELLTIQIGRYSFFEHMTFIYKLVLYLGISSNRYIYLKSASPNQLMLVVQANCKMGKFMQTNMYSLTSEFVIVWWIPVDQTEFQIIIDFSFCTKGDNGTRGFWNMLYKYIYNIRLYENKGEIEIKK